MTLSKVLSNYRIILFQTIPIQTQGDGTIGGVRLTLLGLNSKAKIL